MSSLRISMALLLALGAANTLKAEDAPPARETKAEAKARLLQEFDANNDGKLDASERKAAAKAAARLRKERKAAKAAGFDAAGQAGAQGGAGGGLQGAGGVGGQGSGNSAGSRRGRGPGGGSARLIAKFDVNGNGRLDPPEMKAARAAMEKAQGDRQPGQDGVAPEMTEAQRKILEKFDANGNGQLDPDEAAAARAFRAQALGGRKQ